ncbi:MAG TPA: hypothetical protein VFA41_08505 [Ktedonobacteraceae bacterium]|jgi:hypothetical protein|nr:hypothetical protein [Ktedonobacteraceae bacterium]
MNTEERQQQLRDVLGQFSLPSGINIRAWSEGDFPAIQRISEALGWPSPTMRPDDSFYPRTRLDLFASDESRAFYKACGFRVIYDGMRKSYV